MEEMVEHVRVNLNKELWKIDYATGIAIYLGGNMTINNNNDNSDASHDSDNTTGYNGDITQYLQEKGYMWEQLNEKSIKFRRDN
jgi:hypothetical protein